MTISHLPVPSMRLNLIASPFFQTMSQPGSGLPPLPKSAMDIPTFLDALDRWGQETFLTYQDTKKYHLRPLIVIGRYSTKDIYFPESMLDREGNKCVPQEPKKIDRDVLKDLNPDFPETEIQILESAFKTDVFKHTDTHLYYETQLRKAIDNIMTDAPLFGFKYRQLARVVTDPSDLYQGIRAVYNMVLSFQEYVVKNQVQLDNACGDLISRLRTATLAEFHDGVDAIEKHVKVIQFANSENQETKRVNQIVLSVQHHPNYLVSGVVSDKVDKVPKTFAELRIRMATLPYESLDSWRVTCLLALSTLALKALRGLGRMVARAAV
jgi:hypothetical protein